MSKLAVIQMMGKQIEELAGADIREKVLAGSETIKESTKPEKVAGYMQGAIERLDSLVDQGTREQIMLNCGYQCILYNKTPAERAVSRRKKAKSLEEFLNKEQQNPPPGMRFERDGDILYQYYTPKAFTHPMRCYCGLFRGLPVDQTVSMTYCQCSRGFVQKYWEAILEKPVEVDLLASVISGADECKFAVHL